MKGGLAKIAWVFVCFLFMGADLRGQEVGANDTIIVSGIQAADQVYGLVYLDEIDVLGTYLDPKRRDELNRLRYNVFKVYPYANTAAFILDKVDREMPADMRRKDRKKYIKALEKEMSDRFKNELKDLSMTQGKILVKLINRQTGRDCYSIIKEMKGGLNARIYQTAAFFFDNDLKAQYDPYGKDRDIEMIVREIEAKNYYQYQASKKP